MFAFRSQVRRAMSSMRVVVSGSAGSKGSNGATVRRRLPIGSARAAISLTDAAKKRLSELVEIEKKRAPENNAFLLGVRSRGCNGLSYTLEFTSDAGPAAPGVGTLERVEQDGVVVLIEPTALLSVIGTEMDYKEDPLRSEFVFFNPAATGTKSNVFFCPL